MFYCEACGTKRGWPTYFGVPSSRGPCEICDEVAVCYDVPSHALPTPKKPKPVRDEHTSAGGNYMSVMFPGRGY